MAGDAGPGCGSWDEPAALYFSVTPSTDEFSEVSKKCH